MDVFTMFSFACSFFHSVSCEIHPRCTSLHCCIAFYHRVNTALLIHATVNGHLDNFQFSSIATAASNVLADICKYMYVYVCWVYIYLRIKLWSPRLCSLSRYLLNKFLFCLKCIRFHFSHLQLGVWTDTLSIF